MSYLIIVFNWRHHSNQVICVKDCWRHDQQITMWTTGPDDPICQHVKKQNKWHVLECRHRMETYGLCTTTKSKFCATMFTVEHIFLWTGVLPSSMSAGSWGERDIWAYCRSSTHNSIMNSWLATLRAGFGAYGPAWLRPSCPSNAKIVWPTQQYIR